MFFTATAQKPTPATQPSPAVKPGDPSKTIPTRQPVSPEDQEPIRISTEEVQLSVAAFDNYGRLDPSLQREDVMVLEDGVSQEIRSARRIPANVILLLDTGGELNSAKRVAATREVAKTVVNSLAPGDQISILQFNSKVELLADWTSDHKSVLSILQSKLLPAKRALFFDALAEATARFTTSSKLNRHLVLISDGVHTGAERLDRTQVMQQLAAANVAVHVLSYTIVSQTAMKRDLRRTRKRDKSLVPEDAVASLPDDIRLNTMKQVQKPGGIIMDLDMKRRRLLQEYKNALAVSQAQLQQLAHDTGGGIWLPESVEMMIDNAREAARLIDSAYVISYRPKRPLADAPAGEARRIEIASRRVGLRLMTRERYVVPDNTKPRRTGN
jgi:VWFA-related protein